MPDHTLDVVQFRARFPQFADETAYPDTTLETFWGMAGQFMGLADGCLLSGDPLQLALEYMTAHLLAGLAMTSGGGTPGVVMGSTVDKVSVQLAPPPFKNGWQFWLSTTPYGLSLWALLRAKMAGGLYVGGLPERAGFRKVAGTFWPGDR